MDRRRQKSANFMRYEKHLLLDKVMPYLEIIEVKKTDSLTVEQKVKSWTQVAMQYNLANPKAQRRIAQLKNLYENMKKRTKKFILIYQAELRDTGGKTTLRRIDDVGWRLVKVVPSLKALWKNTLQMKQKLPNHQESSQILTKEGKLFATSEMSLTGENTESGVLIKEEFMIDNCEFLTEGDIVNMSDMHTETQQADVNDCPNLTRDNASDVNNDAEIHLLSQEKRENTLCLSDSLYEMEKDIKKKELEKMELDIEMKRLELEFMKGRLKEQEMNLKFRQLEYDIRLKDL